MALLHPHAANFFLNGKRPKATGNPHPNLAPYSKFQTRTCEVFVAAGNDPAFRKFCELLDMADMAGDPRFATNSARVVHRDALTKKLNARFAHEDGYELTRLMLTAGLPAGPVLNVDEAMAADHTAHRHMVYGPAARVREGVEQWREAGITTPVLVPLSPILRLAPLFGIVIARFSAFRQFPILKRHIGQAVRGAGIVASCASRRTARL
jgi:crotonobetainyl-CoA:carnitine CoA-transferase CaiB-like acyl-CoA transferase